MERTRKERRWQSMASVQITGGRNAAAGDGVVDELVRDGHQDRA